MPLFIARCCLKTLKIMLFLTAVDLYREEINNYKAIGVKSVHLFFLGKSSQGTSSLSILMTNAHVIKELHFSQLLPCQFIILYLAMAMYT